MPKFEDFYHYQMAAQETAVYPGQGDFHGLAYATLGLAGESGEVAEQVKKTWRNDNCEVTPEREDAIEDELGDVLWYVAQMCNELGLDMSSVAKRNIKKLQDRAQEDRLKVHL